jgi:hypothetical protein
VKTIIAMCGLAGSGKDTACNYLVKNHGFSKTSFAAPLKAMAKIAFGFTDEQLYGPSSKREEEDKRYPFSGICTHCGHSCLDWSDCLPEERDVPEGFRWSCANCEVNYKEFVTPRLALQTLGTEWGRRLNDDLWAKSTINLIMGSSHERWCISDLRFRNELDAVLAAGGKVIRLTRGKPQHNHASETQLLSIPLSDFSAILNNEGTIPEMERNLNQLYKDFTR